MVVEVTMTDIQVIEDPQGGTGVHLVEDLLPDTKAGEAGPAVLASLPVPFAIVAVVIAEAGVPFIVALLWRGIEVPHVVKGEGHLHGAGAGAGAGADQNHDHHDLQGVQ